MSDEEVEQEKSCHCCKGNTGKTTDVDDKIQGPACLDYKKTVIAQYSNSPRMLALLDSIDHRIKVCGFFDNFYRNIWNVNTAQGFGLDIWGVIVGVNRTARTFMGFYWGFYEESLLLARPYYDIEGYNSSLYDSNLPNNQQPEEYYGAVGMFRDLQGKDGDITEGDGKDLMQEHTFDDDDFRKLILAKAYANISDFSISKINYLLMTLLGESCCCVNSCETCCKECKTKRSIYIQDNLNMSLTVKLNWPPTKREVALIYNTGLLSRPAGVEMYEIDIQVKES
ncbi:DUF2612 domain-containing protein [Commensalibacter papalotli (ex Servin-Garciduenas et al. 2014)]|uniref:Uncharacterized protein n=1 Tax=Commensalibacter papalotli (ex Servin-Garciduenas et al. 2014) TaxID=1208583 RepID=W7DVZ9_9PROT|nr:DUF2612 domain-containing protein [Commensalibacter papalotli (ex Servin-Garciduenas et al. 2014)]EUK19240.1 hypothetical protein COMX_05800 [Commensalibacter papalotli (ex Servin-Garciduenas et al. 2014)]